MSIFTTIKKIKWKENVSCIQSLKGPGTTNTGPHDCKTQSSRAVPTGAGDAGQRRPCGNSGQVQGTERAASRLFMMLRSGAERQEASSHPGPISNYRALEGKPCDVSVLQPLNVFL